MTIQHSASKHWQPALNRDGVVEGVADVEQCLHVILTTPKGSDPHRPHFGNGGFAYVDSDPDVAAPHLIREAVDAIKQWEPRIVHVTAGASFSNAKARAAIQISYRLADQVQREIEITL